MNSDTVRQYLERLDQVSRQQAIDAWLVMFGLLEVRFFNNNGNPHPHLVEATITPVRRDIDQVVQLARNLTPLQIATGLQVVTDFLNDYNPYNHFPAGYYFGMPSLPTPK